MKPLIAAGIFGVLMMFSALSVKEKKSFSAFAIALLCILTSINIWELVELLQNHSLATGGELHFKNMLRVDAAGLWFNTLLTIITLIYVMLSSKHIEQVGLHVGEYYSLIFFILTGAYLLCTFNNMLILFIGIELISIPQYILAGSDKRNVKSSEASLKYFLMGAFSTGILLMGIALLYGSMGTFFIDQFKFDQIGVDFMMPLAGILFIIIALGFKVSAAPMHFWTPDVYDGAPTPFTAFMATVVKSAIFYGFVLLFRNSFYQVNQEWGNVLAGIILLTLIIGNFTAVFQQSVKRMLAYSSIAQAGFMLFAVLATNALGSKGIIIYGVAYSLATIGIFAVLMKLKDYTYDGFNGLAKSHPFLAFVVTICLLSLAGIPLTAGFFAKYYVLLAVIEQNVQFIWLVIAALIMAAISVYYYFKLIMAMYFKKGTPVLSHNVTMVDKVFLGLVVILIIAIGVYPDLLYTFI
jgi:NADH-quinone oxidoreductase subunit N